MINNEISPISRNINITSFLKVSPVKIRSFEKFEFSRPDDFCYIKDNEVEFTNTHGNLHLEFSFINTRCSGHEVFFRIKEIFVYLSEI